MIKINSVSSFRSLSTLLTVSTPHSEQHKRSCDLHQHHRCEQVLQVNLPHHSKASSEGTAPAQCLQQIMLKSAKFNSCTLTELEIV